MNTELMKNGISVVIEGLELVLLGLEGASKEEVKEMTKEVKKQVEAVVPETSEVEETSEDLDECIDLENLSFNELKAMAKDKGLKAGGTKAELIARINEAEGCEAVEEEPQEAPKEKKSNVLPFKKKAEEVEAEEIEEDPFIVEVREAVADLSNEEIAEALTSAGIKPSGKRESLIAKLAKAVEEGKISLSDEEDEEESDEEELTADDLINDYDNPEMTDERKEALKKFDKGSKLLLKKVKLEDAQELVGQFYDLDSLEDSEVFDLYLEIKKRLIDDDGDAHNMSDGYYLNGEIACCGTFLEDGKCSICGEEYDV